MKEKPWFVYIIRCKDGKLYTGMTNDVERRVAEHNRGDGCRFTKYRCPVKLIYKENCGTKSLARRRELKIQAFKRSEKLELITK